jgi:DNA-3-methyladenine glycosylase
VIDRAFYGRPVLEVAPDLIGCVVRHGETAGIIVETEAYHRTEPASHAWAGLTARTAPLFGPPGVAYVYFSYGIHSLLNAVCDEEESGAAVLIRALQPLEGVEVMRARRGVARDEDLCNGPGTSLIEGPIRIEPRAPGWEAPQIASGRRIGITKAVDLDWRFCARGNRHVSRPWPAAERRAA